MPSVRAISDQTGFIEGKLTYRRLIAARTESNDQTKPQAGWLGFAVRFANDELQP